MDYAVNRYYGPSTGRFNRPDPFRGSASIAVPQSMNRYTYVGNDSINKTDPLGLICPTECYNSSTGECKCPDDPSTVLPGRGFGVTWGDIGLASVNPMVVDGEGLPLPVGGETSRHAEWQNLLDWIAKRTSDKCREFLRNLGMEEFLGWFQGLPNSMIVNYNSNFAGSEVMGFGPIPNGTYRNLFDQVQNASPPGGLLVALTVPDIDSSNRKVGVLPVIILGPAFYDQQMVKSHPEASATLTLAGSMQNFQAISLLHELFHVKMGGGLSHRAMADAMKIPYQPDNNQAASMAIDNFFAGGCKK
jgi:hypothetical protein